MSIFRTEPGASAGRTAWISMVALAAAGCAMAAASPAPAAEGHAVVPAGTVEWGPGPASIEKGAEAAVLYGDPGAEELFALRLKLPDGYHIAPHTHPRPEIVTIISGTLLLGTGEEADRATAEVLETGSFFGFEPGMTHYVYAKGETVIQLNSMGPWSIEYVNEDDDPRR
ncbi:MAG: cupin domain-containing protein [Tistlia sp.]|uniref:cupin domain-containing protein n=1 Tax=Tistlia sp. TaxID=3057121 RepID=UPI0034A4ABC1